MALDVASVLPAEIAQRSLAADEIILPPDAAVQAIEHLSQQGRTLESWEGMMRFADGTRARSLEHPGAFALPTDAGEAARRAIEGIRAAHARWQRAPEHPTAELLVHLVLAGSASGGPP